MYFQLYSIVKMSCSYVHITLNDELYGTKDMLITLIMTFQLIMQPHQIATMHVYWICDREVYTRVCSYTQVAITYAVAM